MDRCEYFFDIGDGKGNVERSVCTLEKDHEMPHKAKVESVRPDDRWEWRQRVAAALGLDKE